MFLNSLTFLSKFLLAFSSFNKICTLASYGLLILAGWKSLAIHLV
uniref:Uncharacterized protein n=1 Tax=Arundo donax TaxID=35708 RepID=A0A0A8Y315_ARUDO